MSNSGGRGAKWVSVALCAIVLLAGSDCTKVSTSVGNGAQPSSLPGILRISDISDPSTLNPMLSGADIAYQLSAFTLEYLVQLDDQGNLMPVLCERVPSIANGDISNDGLTVTYHLRHGVQWSDGAPFGAADIVASWRQEMNPLNNTISREAYEVVERIDAPDPYTAVVHLKHRYAPLPTRFFAGIQENPVAVMPAHIIANQRELNTSPFSSHPIGTGPFVLQSWERSGRMVFVANPHYWRGTPKLKEIIFQAQPSTATELVSFQTHEVDANFDAGPGRLPEYSTLTGMRVLRSQSLRLGVAVMNTQRFPFDDVHVRHALAYAIDRGAILHDVMHDAGVVADEMIPSWSWAYTPNVPRYPFDQERARTELAEDGWRPGPDGILIKDGRQLTAVLASVAGDQPGARLDAMVQAYLRQIGFSLTIKAYPYGIIFDNDGPIRTGNYNLAFYTFSVNYDPSALDQDGCDQFSPRGDNDTRYCDPTIDRLERQALAMTDVAQRKTLYAAIQQRRMTSLPTLPMYFRERVGVVSDQLAYYTASRGIIPQWNAWQWSKP
ncbi:MAG: peptide ABC transporter substrate-binding protein [Candidatus Eremiobacteraeota bacterium]|nr:peptide ABC transporter substrate-binding protein [Candidatus Eremiobacteraeota bacterium]